MYKFELDDENLRIQGVSFDDVYTYWFVRNAALSNVYAGWEPTTTDIQRGKDQLTTPDYELIERYNEVFNENV